MSQIWTYLKSIWKRKTAIAPFDFPMILADHLDHPVFIKDLETLRFVYCNELAAKNIYNTSAENVLGKNVAEFYGAERAAIMEAHDRTVASSPGGQSEREQMITNPLTGKPQILRVRKRALAIGSETPNLLMIITEDVTALRQSEYEKEVFFTASLDMVVVADSSGQPTRVSAAVFDTLGYTPEEFCAIKTMDLLHPDDVIALEAHIQQHACGDQTQSIENRYRAKNGEYKWISWRCTQVGDQIFGIGRDITAMKTDFREQKRVAEEAQRLRHLSDLAAQGALESSRLKSEFLANMSHEIRTPMNGVIGMVGLLLDTPLSPEQTDIARSVESSADALLTIINDILDFSKIEAGQLTFENLEFNMHDLLHDTNKAMRFLANRQQVKLSLNDRTLIEKMVKGDPGRIRQICTNLVGNAIKFTSHGTVDVSVTTEAETANDYVLKFMVKDSGIGISPSVAATLFKPFTQADASTTRRYGGTGLGLSICKRLVEQMGGEIGVESEVGRGSTFWFTVCLEKGTAISSSVPKQGLTQQKLQFARVLVAEDNIVNQKIILKQLERLGLRGDAVASGHEALHALQTIPYDLILMDCQMPELDGYETTGRIRTGHNIELRRIPIIALTANAFAEDRERCLKSGMDDFISKPVSLGPLAQVLERWITVSRAA